MKTKITLINGEIIEGNLHHFHHKHPNDKPENKERKNWHYYVDENTKDIHHLRKEHINLVTQ